MRKLSQLLIQLVYQSRGYGILITIMFAVNRFLDSVRTLVRSGMRHLARVVNKLSRGRIHPNHVTLFGLFAHVPVAWLIATGHYGWAAIGLVVFGLMDALDGELARLQHRASNVGMLLDATTDRIKETFLYAGVAYSLAASTNPGMAMWAVLACGMSLSVSYVKAKGEVAVSGSGLSPNEVNRLFQDGLLRFEVRMAILVIGLATHWIAAAVIVIALLASYTVIERLVKISRKL